MIRKLQFLFSIMVVLGLAIVGCEIQDDADGDSGTGGKDTGGGGTDTGKDTGGGGPIYLDYRFVRMDDLSPKADTVDGGADVDAIILDKATEDVETEKVT
jgi:hypothetical protein